MNTVKKKDYIDIILFPMFIMMAALSSYVIVIGIKSGEIVYSSRFSMGRICRNIDWMDYAMWGTLLVFSLWLLTIKTYAIFTSGRKCG